jgi:hypothetical protein
MDNDTAAGRERAGLAAPSAVTDPAAVTDQAATAGDTAPEGAPAALR